MKRITLEVPDGVFKLVESMAMRENKTVEELAAEALSQRLTAIMDLKANDTDETTIAQDLGFIHREEFAEDLAMILNSVGWN